MRPMRKTVAQTDMAKEAAAFVASLAPRTTATIVTLSGDLGAGKTTFVQGIATALGVEERVTSPTFVIVKIYDLHDQAFRKLIHMDAYRLKGPQHLKVLGWEEMANDPQNLIFIEWPEKIGNLPGAIPMSFAYSEGGRDIIYG
jgi:tRNA threonylcarbamoyladenosine biosynthesis protein TsaE